MAKNNNIRQEFRNKFFNSGIYSFLSGKVKLRTHRDKRAEIFDDYGNAQKGIFGNTITFKQR
jgi:hypothetical protein